LHKKKFKASLKIIHLLNCAQKDFKTLKRKAIE